MKVHPAIILITILSLLLLGCDQGGSNRDLAAGTTSIGDGDTKPPIIPDNKIVPKDPEGGPNDDNDPDGGDPGGDPGAGDPGTGGDAANGNGEGDGEQPVPEPSTIVLVGSGIAIISLCKKRKAKQKKS